MEINIGLIQRALARRAPALAAGAALAVATAAATFGSASGASAATPTAPPPLTVLTSHGPVGNGDIFITPTGDTSTYANGPEILSRSGKVIWFHAVPSGQSAFDFRTQTYKGQPVLTWVQGTGLGATAQNTDYIYNDHYQQIASVTAGNGLTTDVHEFLITPWNTALITAVSQQSVNLTSIGGPADQQVLQGSVQEIDIKTGKVLFQWNAQDHIPYSASEQPLPASASTPWDWYHINAVHLGPNRTILIDSRDSWTTTDVSLRTGRVNWILGGKASTFKQVAAPGQTLNSANDLFAWQHDPEWLGNDEISIFDDESAGTANTGQNVITTGSTARVDYIKLNFRTDTATLVKSDPQPEDLSASSQGNAQPLPFGGAFVGWGNLPYISQFDRAGHLLFNAQFPTGVNTYRAYLLPWNPGEHSSSHPGSGIPHLK
jgi:Arylsulfotransferase (ASST)